MELTPKEIVEHLDKYIVGQEEAKRAVAIALRNRYRRSRLPDELRDEIIPKNILMIGPTGVGKTEIARRLAKLANAPFIKVEATKFTEVGYVGRDVESIVRDLVESAIRMVKAEKFTAVENRARAAAKERILSILVPIPGSEKRANPFGVMFGMGQRQPAGDLAEISEERLQELKNERLRYRKLLELGELDNTMVEIEVEDQPGQFFEVFSSMGMEDLTMSIQDALGGMMPKRRHRRRTTVKEALRILTQEEADKLIDIDSIAAEAVTRCEQMGIVFIDEIDKIAGKSSQMGPDVSREGVQRDILPIVEGGTVMTKYGPVRTDHILFIAAGAFHIAKPSDLIPELQGRFPIRVELSSLKREDFKRILTEPENALIKQYSALLKTESVELEFTSDGIDAIAQFAEEVNGNTEDIGARRLHTIMERLLESLMFEADQTPRSVVIDQEYIHRELGPIVADRDLSRYIL